MISTDRPTIIKAYQKEWIHTSSLLHQPRNRLLDFHALLRYLTRAYFIAEPTGDQNISVFQKSLSVMVSLIVAMDQTKTAVVINEKLWMMVPSLGKWVCVNDTFLGTSCLFIVITYQKMLYTLFHNKVI